MRLRTMLDRAERASALDRPSNFLMQGVQKVLPQPMRNLLHGVWLGHPLHPMAVMLPLGSWLSASILDLVDYKGRATSILIGVGSIGAAPAAAAGLNDWASLAPEQRRVGLIHAASNSAALGLYAGSLLTRRRRPRLGRSLAYAGLAAAGIGGYIGGHLSYRQSAAVNHAAPYLRRIEEGWHDVCAYAELTPGKPLVATVGDVPVLLVRGDHSVTAMIGVCGHQTGPLGEGEMVSVDGQECVVCPWHGSTFRLVDGVAMRGPAATGQPVLRSRISEGRVQVSVP